MELLFVFYFFQLDELYFEEGDIIYIIDMVSLVDILYYNCISQIDQYSVGLFYVVIILWIILGIYIYIEIYM